LSQTQWPSLQQLTIGKSSVNLDRNRISKAGNRYFSKANWKELSVIGLSIDDDNLDRNIIHWEGCKYISTCDWPLINDFHICKTQM